MAPAATLRSMSLPSDPARLAAAAAVSTSNSAWRRSVKRRPDPAGAPLPADPEAEEAMEELEEEVVKLRETVEVLKDADEARLKLEREAAELREAVEKAEGQIERLKAAASGGREELEKLVAELEETVREQEEEIEQLSADLEEERAAASSAADETMMMIQRLQRERADSGMEARQFKRIASEKMSHDQDLVSRLQELVAKRDQEIESLSAELDASRKQLEYGETSRALKRFETSPPGSSSSSIVMEKGVVEQPERAAVRGRAHFRQSSNDSFDDADEGYGMMNDVYPIQYGESRRKGRRSESEPDLRKIYMRLEALEADKEAMKRAIKTVNTEKAQLVVLRGIAQQLCREIAEERRITKQKSLVESFSPMTIFKWIFTLIFQRKNPSHTRFVFGLSSVYVGLLMFLDKSTRRWRCLPKT